MYQQKQFLLDSEVKTGRSNKKISTHNNESRLTYLLTSRRAAANKYMKGFRNTQTNLMENFNTEKKNSVSIIKNSLITLDHCDQLSQNKKMNSKNSKLNYCTINPQIITTRKAFIDKHLKTQEPGQYIYKNSPKIQCIITRKYKNSKPMNTFRLKTGRLNSSVHKNNFLQQSPYAPSQSPDISKRMKSQPAVKFSSLMNKKGGLDLCGYEYAKELGTGGYARVVLAKRIQSNKIGYFAIKIYDKIKTQQKSKVTNIPREIKIMLLIDHPNICKIQQQHENKSTHFIIMQYCGCQSLFRKIGESQSGYLTEKQAKRYFRKILDAFVYLHEKRIAHRDVKAENILVHKGQIKLIDFGFSVIPNYTDLVDSYCGTPAYMAPQIFNRTPYNPFHAQIWSLGVLLYLMLQGLYPFLSSSQQALILKIKKANYKIIKPISEQAKSLIRDMLNITPSQRISLKRIQKHGWFLQNQDL